VRRLGHLIKSNTVNSCPKFFFLRLTRHGVRAPQLVPVFEFLSLSFSQKANEALVSDE
jgi:hypothetical protein